MVGQSETLESNGGRVNHTLGQLDLFCAHLASIHLFCGLAEAACDDISSRFVKHVIVDKSLEFDDPGLNSCQEMRLMVTITSD